MSKIFHEGRSMVSVRLPDDLRDALVRSSRREEITLTETIEKFCWGYIEQNYCEDCQNKLFGKIPENGICEGVDEEEEDQQ